MSDAVRAPVVAFALLAWSAAACRERPAAPRAATVPDARLSSYDPGGTDVPIAGPAQSPALAWGPGVVGLAYVRDERTRSVVALDRFVDGTLHGTSAALGNGAAREPATVAWTGEAFALAWGEPRELVPEVFVGLVDAAGEVHWNASRLTETLRTGRWRSPGRTTVESKDPRILALGNVLLLSWRTRIYPEAHPLFFASVVGLEVSEPAAIGAETDFVLDHQLVPWGSGAAAVYTGRFERTQRLVRVARLSVSPPSVGADWLVAEIAQAPEWLEVSAAPVGEDLFVVWRAKTEWNSVSNVAFARVTPQGPADASGRYMLLDGTLMATPTTNLPRRTFAVAPAPGGFVLAWAFAGDPKTDQPSGLRVRRFDGQARPVGGWAEIPTDVRLARDPVLVRGGGNEYWFAFVYGNPPAERGRTMFGSVVCGE
jgi:hypothetical protein